MVIGLKDVPPLPPGAIEARLPAGAGDRFTVAFPPDRDELSVIRDLFDRSRLAMCVTDPSEHDNPIVYANAAFERLTGYAAHEIIGRNCRFLQGPQTALARAREVGNAVRKDEVIVTELVNYRKDGTPFRNALHVGPIHDQHGKVRFYFGSQWDVSEIERARERERAAAEANVELQQRMDNLFAVVSSIVTLSAAESPDARAGAEKARSRITALARAHGTGGPAGRTIEMQQLAGEVIALAAGQHADRVVIEGASLVLRSGAVTPVGLIVHELGRDLRDADRRDGEARLEWSVEGDRFHLLWRHSGHTGGATSETGTGARILDAMAATLGGIIVPDEGDPTTIRIDVPLGNVTLT